LYLRIQLTRGDSFPELVGRVAQEYCSAYEHADFSYLAVQCPRPGFANNALFNWVPGTAKFGGFDMDLAASGIQCSRIHFAPPIFSQLNVDHEPELLLYDTVDGVVGGVHFPLNRFSIGMMQTFVQNFLIILERVLQQPQKRVRDIVLLH
jgi:hypothetical protein